MRALALALPVLLLAACGDPTVVTPVPTPSITPVFASDEEALAAAEEAYARYLAVSDAIAADGGADPERLAPIVTMDWLDHEVESFEDFAETGRRQVGETGLVRLELQRFDNSELVVYVCVDFTATSFVDGAGLPVEREGPPNATLETSFDLDAEGALRLSRSDLWSQSIC